MPRREGVGLSRVSDAMCQLTRESRLDINFWVSVIETIEERNKVRATDKQCVFILPSQTRLCVLKMADDTSYASYMLGSTKRKSKQRLRVSPTLYIVNTKQIGFILKRIVSQG